MSQRHKHYDAIVAFAEGKKLQYKPDGEWLDWNDLCAPTFNEHREYRVKPASLMYRVALLKWPHSTTGLHVCTYLENKKDNREKWSGFVRWVTDWQEVEV